MNQEQNVKGLFLNTGWLKKAVMSVVVMLLLITSAYSQELPKNLLYANENLKFEKIYKLGEYKVLHFSDQMRQNKRFMYLLNERNVVVDTMKVSGSDYLLPRSDSTFSIKNLGDLFEFKISEGKFQTLRAIDVSALFFL